jgi:hypothetical protein
VAASEEDAVVAAEEVGGMVAASAVSEAVAPEAGELAETTKEIENVRDVAAKKGKELGSRW